MPAPSRNGSASARTQLIDLRAENDLRREKIRSARLAREELRAERQRRLVESLSVDWVTPYAELLDLTRRSGDPVLSGPTSAWQRQQGRNWPIYQTEVELNLLRAPARVLVATNTYAQGMLHGLASYVISTGYTYRPAKRNKRSELPQAVIDAVQRVVDQILERNQWHGGEQPALETELFERSVEDGEFVLCHYRRADGWTDFRAREPEQLTQPPGSDTAEYGFGILTPRDDAADVKRYYLQHGDTPEQGEEYDPDEVTHYRRNVRRSMKRGISDFTFSAYDAINLADKLRGNLSKSGAQQAAIVGVRQHENGSQQDIQAFIDADADGTETNYLTGGQIGVKWHRGGDWEDIPKGLNYVKGPGAENAVAHLSILQACLRGAVVKWNGFEWLISADASNNNYASSLTAESPFVRRVLSEQRGYREAFKKAVWFAVEHYIRTNGLRDETGRVWSWEELEHELDLLVEAPSPETRNKLEESQRAQIDIQLGVDSRQQFAQRQGRDWDQIQTDNKEYAEHSQQQQQPGAGDVPPGLFESDDLLEGFTGTDSHGHHWVNGKQVAAAPAIGEKVKAPVTNAHAGLSAAIAEYHAAEPDSLAHRALEAALANAGIEDPTKPPKKLNTNAHDVAAAFVSAWLETQRLGKGDPAASEPLAKALRAMGAEQVGTAGETVAFDGQLHDSQHAVATGSAVKVSRPGWVLKDGERTMRLVSATVEPAKRVESLDPPDTLDRALLESGFTGTVTDKAGHRRTYQDGKQVASQHDGSASARTEPTPEEHLSAGLKALEDSPEAKANPGIVAKVKEKAVRIAETAKRLVYEAALKSPQILGIWTAIFDHPDDLKKIGYNPSFSGTSHATSDPVKVELGIPAHMACALVVKVGAAAMAWAKLKLAKTESLSEVDLAAAGELFHAILSAAAQEFGLPEPPKAEEIAAKLKGLISQ